ncbi:unnamed protein product, partial [Mesorhabditis belari]|uniref:Uncharacterized protein n=1 Tax=Mesorhabditis belari TaxID=2138241 RepID=A0AAF3EJ74_9BILA
MRGIVVFISHGIAFVYTSESPTELLLDTRIIGNSKIETGQWLDCNAYKTYVERFRKIQPSLKTEVIDGKVQVETVVRVTDTMLFDSSDFGKVAYLAQKPMELKSGQLYRCMVTRDIEGYSETYANLSVKWHILPNTLFPANKDMPNVQTGQKASIWADMRNGNTTVQDVSSQHPFAPSQTSVLLGVVIGQRGSRYIIYTRAGFVTMTERWKRENVEAPKVGDWIQFKSKEIEPKKRVVDSNSFRQVPPLYITTIENGQVNLIVPAYVKNGNIFTEFVKDTNNKEFKNGRLREAKVLVWPDDKGRYRWKLAEKQNYLLLREAKNDKTDFTKDVVVTFEQKMEN